MLRKPGIWRKSSTLVAVLVAFAFPAWSQVTLSPLAAASNHSPSPIITNQATATTNIANSNALVKASEQIRTDCIKGRRRVCGKVLQIVPEGLVVESGYTSLLRPELSRSWLAPGTVVTSRPENLIEENNPGSVCVGEILITDIPKKPKVSLYDYVILEAYPAGEYVYTPVPTVKKTIRRFSVGLRTAIKLNFDLIAK